MSWLYIKPSPFTYRVHFTGVGYYYTDETGSQLSKQYATIESLHKYGKVMIWD